MPTSAEYQRFDLAAAARAARFFDMDYLDYADDLPALQALARRTGGPLLELGCGTGRLAVPLAAAGFRVTGVDLSPEMLAFARARSASVRKAAAGLTWVEGDFSHAQLGGPYQLAFIVMNTFLHLLSQEEQLTALRHWHAHLAPGGTLLIDILAPSVDELAGLDGQAQLDKSWRNPETGATVLKWVARTVEPAEQIMHVAMIYDESASDGNLQRTVVAFDLRYLWRFEAELLLEKAGFTIEAVYGGWDLEPYDSGSERLILIARKP